MVVCFTIYTFWVISTVIYIVPFLTKSSTNCFSFARFFCVSKFLALEASLGVGNIRSCLFFQVSNVDFFWNVLSFDCHSIQAKAHRDPFNSNNSLWFDSFLISSSMLSSSTHLMTNFLEFNVQWGVTLTGIEPISIVVLKRFLLWCFFSTSIKILPDSIGLHCLGRPFAMPSTAFLGVDTSRFNEMFLSVASMMRNHGHWLSFWFVWLYSWFFSLDCVVGFEVEHGGDVLFCRFMLIMVWWGLEVFLQDKIH